MWQTMATRKAIRGRMQAIRGPSVKAPLVPTPCASRRVDELRWDRRPEPTEKHASSLHETMLRSFRPKLTLSFKCTVEKFKVNVEFHGVYLNLCLC